MCVDDILFGYPFFINSEWLIEWLAEIDYPFS